MSDDLRNTLEARRRAVAAKAARDLLDESPTLTQTLEDLDKTSRVLDALPAAPQSKVLPLAIGLASILIVALAWLTPIGAVGIRTIFQLEATSRAVGLAPSESFDWRPNLSLSPGEARLTAARVEGWEGVPASASFTALTSESLALQSIGVPADGRLALKNTNAGAIEIGIEGSGATAELLIHGSGNFEGTAFTHRVPEILRFGTSDAGRPPIAMTVTPVAPLRLSGLPVSAVRFGASDGRGGFISTLEKATLRLPQTGQEFSLGARDAILMDALQAQVVELAAAPGAESLQLVLTGASRRVSLEQAGVLRRVTPSILDYILENQRLAFLFGALSAIWGLMWSAKRLFLS